MPSEDKSIRLGLCCMNTTLKKLKPPIYASRKIIVRIIDEKGIEEKMKELSIQKLYEKYPQLNCKII